MALFKILSLIMLALLGDFGDGVAAVAKDVVIRTDATAQVPIAVAMVSTTTTAVCSYETLSTAGASDISTLPGIVCPHFFTISGSYKHGPYSNHTSYVGNSSIALVTLVSTSTELSTINPSAVIENITATSTISNWYTATETYGGHNTTISYLQILSYSILGVHATTFLAPPTPIVYTVKHTLTSTMSANATSPPATGVGRRLLPSSHIQDGVDASGSDEDGGVFVLTSKGTTTTGVDLLPLSSLSGDLPLWTDTMGASSGNGTTTGSLPTVKLPNITMTDTVVITTTWTAPVGTGTGADSFTTVASGPGANVTYVKPSPSEHKSPGVAVACWDFTAALVTALVVIFAF